jgi:hypothetical protein
MASPLATLGSWFPMYGSNTKAINFPSPHPHTRTSTQLLHIPQYKSATQVKHHASAIAWLIKEY